MTDDKLRADVARLETRVAELERKLETLELEHDVIIGVAELEAGLGLTTNELREKLKEKRQK